MRTRAYNRYTLDTFNGTFTKFSDTQALRDEIEYYKSVPEPLKLWFPRILKYDASEGQDAWIEMEYYQYRVLGDLMINPTPIPDDMWSKILTRLRTVLAEWSNYRPQSPGWIADAEEFASRMYIDKTWNEYEKLVEDLPDKKVLTEPKTVIINDVDFYNFHIIWPDVIEYLNQEVIPSTRMCFIHGDFCFSNILYARDERALTFKFVDPRGSFGEVGVWGDPRYDAAKLMHSADGGYEFLSHDQFSLRRRGMSSRHLYDYELGFTNGDNTDISADFDRIFFAEDHRFDRKQIMTIQGLLYISMAARHYENSERQIAQYLIGVEKLNEAMSL